MVDYTLFTFSSWVCANAAWIRRLNAGVPSSWERSERSRSRGVRDTIHICCHANATAGDDVDVSLRCRIVVIVVVVGFGQLLPWRSSVAQRACVRVCVCAWWARVRGLMNGNEMLRVPAKSLCAATCHLLCRVIRRHSVSLAQ